MQRAKRPRRVGLAPVSAEMAAPHLIYFDTDINVQRRSERPPQVCRPIQPRSLIHLATIALVGSVMRRQPSTRTNLGVYVLHDRNPLAVTTTDAGVRKSNTLRLRNKQPNDRQVESRLTELQGTERRVRQDEITAEITDLAAGESANSINFRWAAAKRQGDRIPKG